MTNISDDRIKELREWLTSLTSGSDDDIRADLLSILDDYASLRAEVERLKENVQRCEENYAVALHLASTYQETAEKAEAQLAKQAPLIQAVMGLDEIDFIADDWPSEKLRESADKLRSEK